MNITLWFYSLVSWLKLIFCGLIGLIGIIIFSCFITYLFWFYETKSHYYKNDYNLPKKIHLKVKKYIQFSNIMIVFFISHLIYVFLCDVSVIKLSALIVFICLVLDNLIIFPLFLKNNKEKIKLIIKKELEKVIWDEVVNIVHSRNSNEINKRINYYDRFYAINKDLSSHKKLYNIIIDKKYDNYFLDCYNLVNDEYEKFNFFKKLCYSNHGICNIIDRIFLIDTIRKDIDFILYYEIDELK